MTQKLLVVDTTTGFHKQYTPVVTSAGAGNAGDVPGLDSTGKLDNSVMPVGIGADTVSITASEALSAGNWVNIYNNAGTPNCRKADGSTTGKQADGFVLAAVSNGAAATVYLSGQNTQVTGMTAGPVFLSDSTAGAGTVTPPTTAGHTLQRVGTAVSATSVEFKPSLPIEL